MEVAVHQGIACHTATLERRRSGGQTNRPRFALPTRRPPWKPLFTHLCAMSRHPHSEVRVAAFVVALRISSGHHPEACRCESERAATALQRAPLRWSCSMRTVYLRHTPSLRRLNHRVDLLQWSTRHRLITPEARDLPLLAMLVTETVTSLALCRTPRIPPWRGLHARRARMISAGRT